MTKFFAVLLSQNLQLSTRAEINATLKGTGKRSDLSYKEADLLEDADSARRAHSGRANNKLRSVQFYRGPFAKNMNTTPQKIARASKSHHKK